ncbi:hypothetical protein [Shinella sp. M31]|uniref:hypothetical protein n=1 Tax=Shinella sp. M31 TaxID=3368615 RepID=UPI003BA19E48
MTDALAAEAEKLGGEIQHRDDGVFLVVKTDCECGALRLRRQPDQSRRYHLGEPVMTRKRKSVTVTMRINRDGSHTYQSTGGFDLRKLFPELRKPAGEPSQSAADATLSLLDYPADKEGNADG